MFYRLDEKAPLFAVIQETKPFIKQTIGVPFTLVSHKPSYSHELARDTADVRMGITWYLFEGKRNPSGYHSMCF